MVLVQLSGAIAEQGVVDTAAPIAYCANGQFSLTRRMK